MYSTEKDKKNIFLSWQFVALKILALAAVSIWLDKPSGTMEGRIAFEEKGGFHNYTYNVGSNKVYAIAVGPREGSSEEERGVWIDSKGHFKIDRLPVGEYQLKVRAPGFQTEYKPGILVEEAKITHVKDVSMTLLAPSVSIASSRRVFTTKDAPAFWVNTSGCGKTLVHVYKKDIMDLRSTQKALATHGYELSQNLSFTRTNYGSGAPQSNPFALETPLKSFEKVLEQNYEDSASAQFKFDKPLPPGDYVVEAEGYPVMGSQEALDISWFSVSDLGLIVMRAPEKTVVRAMDLTTLKPVKGATISSSDFYFYKKHKYPDVQTDANGFATLKPRSLSWGSSTDSPYAGSGNLLDPATGTSTTEDVNGPHPMTTSLLVSGQLGTSHAYDDIAYYAPMGEHYTTYFYTERPVYRLGQSVFFKGIVRENTQNGFKNDGAGMNLAVSITDPESNEVWTGTIKTSKHGTFKGMYNIPADGHTGAYSVNITFADKTTANGAFEVAEYKKPEYIVEVAPTAPRFIDGEKMKMKVHATYYFGGSVSNAKVHYTVYKSSDYATRFRVNPRPDYYGFYDDWEGEGNINDYSGEFVSDGYVQTDATGDAIVEFDTPKPTANPEEDPTTDDYADKRFKVEAEVTDISRQAVLGNASGLAVAGSYELFVEPESYVTSVGEDIKMKVKAIDYDGKPVANQNVKVLLTRYDYNKSDSQTHLMHIADVSVTTGADGSAVATIPCQKWPSDAFNITGVAKDSGGHTIVGHSSIWVSNTWEPYFAHSDEEAQAQTISIKMDKPVYKPGEKARFVISGPVTGKEGTQAVFSIQGPKLYSYQVIKMDATTKVVEVPMTKEYAPNVFASVTMLDAKGKYYTQEEMVKVSPESHFMKVAITTDKAKYHPGDKVTYTVKATNADGSPAKDAEVSLGIVDESIYAIRPETAANIDKSFYSRRENSVVTSCSFPEEYSGGPDKNSVANPKIRKNFKDLADWKPELITNAQGIATAVITLPDNLTTWRATARAVSMQTDVGETIQKIMSTQDLILRLSLPRFFSQGDEGLLTAVVHNYSDVEQKVKLTLAASSEFATETPLVQTLDLMPEKAGRFSWPVKVQSAGRGKIMVKAIGQTASDAMEQTVPINMFGVPTFACSSGLITDDQGSASIPSGMSTNGVLSTADYKVELASSTLGPVLGNFDKLIEYPYGCTEQTMSRMIPSVVAMQLHKKLNQPLSADKIALFKKVDDKALEKIRGYHHNDGGWGWWQNDTSRIDLTALVVNGMLLLQDAGYTPDADFIPGGKKFLETTSAEMFKQLTDKDLKEDVWITGENKMELAKAIYVLSEVKDKPTTEQIQYFKKQLLTLPPEALEYMCLACHQGGNNAEANVFYKRLMDIANTSAETTDWEHTRALIKRFVAKDGFDYTYSYTGVETTAVGLKCVLTMEPNNVEKIEQIKKWLMLHRDSNGWENTKTTSEVFLVLMQDELQARAKGQTGNFTAHVSLSDKTIADFVANADNLYESQKIYKLTVPKHPTDLKIDKSGPGRLYWTSLMTYFRTLEHDDQLSTKGMPTGLQISRKFFRIVPTITTSDGTTHFHSQEITDGKVKAGETILMKTVVNAPTSLPYICVEAPLPSGGEIVENSSEENSVNQAESDDAAAEADKTKDSDTEGDWGSNWWTHQDVLDDKIVYFGTSIPSGKSEFTTLIRMELPGKVGVNPVNLYGMYTDKVKAYSNINELVVTE